MDEKNKKAVWIKLAVGMTMAVIGVCVIFLRRCHYESIENRAAVS